MSISGYLDAIGSEVTNQEDMIEIARTALLNKAAGGGDTFLDFGGKNPIKVGEHNQTFRLSDTTFPIGNVPSGTTAVDIRQPENDDALIEGFGGSDKDVVVVVKLRASTSYNPDFVKISTTDKTFAIRVYARYDKTTVTEHSNFRLHYYDQSGVGLESGNSYGIYASQSTPIISIDKSGTITVKLKSPTITYRSGNSTYCSTESMNNVIDFSVDWNVEVYTVDKGTSIFGVGFTYASDFFNS